ncbi:MAG: bifunctional 3,4-dihydroxy-2-butanone-4-phosphate synthase/GTP cyclohydrolase II, partial [Planctomycetota bacterium JB042]
GLGTQILRHLGVRKLHLLTNNPRKYHGLRGYGLTIVSRVPIEVEPNPKNEKYLRTKAKKLGHVLDWVKDDDRSGGGAS